MVGGYPPPLIGKRPIYFRFFLMKASLRGNFKEPLEKRFREKIKKNFKAYFQDFFKEPLKDQLIDFN